MKTPVYIGLVACLLVASLRAEDGASEPPFRYYSTVDGLTQAEVHDIAQDRAGHLWFTTRRGLNRYDGRTFRHFTIANGLPVNNLTAVLTTGSGSVWVGDSVGNVSLLVGDRIHSTASLARPTAISDLAVIAGRVYAATAGNGLQTVQQVGDQLQISAAVDSPSHISAVLPDAGFIWLVAQEGLYRWQPGEAAQLVAGGIRHAFLNDKGLLWVVDDQQRVGLWGDGRMQVLVDRISPDPVVSLIQGRKGTVWVATEKVLYSFSGSEPRQAADSLMSYSDVDVVVSLFVDREDTLWIAGESRLIRFLGDRFRHYRLKTGGDSETVWTIAEDRHQRLWYGTQSKLLTSDSAGRLQPVGAAHGLAPGPVRGLAADASGNLWVGVRGGGLHYLDVDALTAQRIDGTAELEILDLVVSQDGSIWLGTAASGLVHYSADDGLLVSFPVLADEGIYTLDIGPDNSIWFGVDNLGVVRMRPAAGGGYEQQVYDQQHGLTHATFNHVRVTGANSAWVGTEDGGLYTLNDGVFSNLGGNSPLSDQTVYLIEPLEDGTLIVGGEQGLYQMDLTSRRVVRYHPGVGFVGMETNAHATFFDSSGGLWIGTVDGATRMDTTLPMDRPVALAPQLLVMETVLERRAVMDHTSIAPGDRSVHVEFAAVSLLQADQVEYSYQLEGLDPDWGAATTNQIVNYSSLDPGQYVFRVRARFPGNEWSDAVASRPFNVLAPYWQQGWFIAIAVVGFLSLIAGLFQYRTRVVAGMNQRLRLQVAERTHSIEQARQSLEDSYQKLSAEIVERKRSDQARAEVEARFRQAFEHAPIGMGLVDENGCMFNVNPLLRQMFWHDDADDSPRPVSDFIDPEHQPIFDKLFASLLDGRIPIFNEEIICSGPQGDSRQAVVCLSAVRDDSGQFLYAVLQVQDVTEARALTEQLEYQANYDELTGLLNRRSFEMELKRAYEAGNSEGNNSYLLFMDLDQFKIVNDTSGHVAGDQLLRAISGLLQESVRANDAVGRLGGDEFALLLWHCPANVAERVAESIRAAVEDFQFHWDNETFRIGVSIGGVPIDHGIGDLNELQQLADAACYAAKEAGRNRVHMACGQRKDAAVEHRGEMRWVQRLRDAMDHNRFTIYGQVIKPLWSNGQEPERMEVLLRMRDPKTRRLVPPGAFLPAAERYGLTMKMDQWVVQNLLRSLIVHEAFEASGRKYWVNLSGTSIGDKKFAEFLVGEMERSPLPPGMINFEITETAVIRSVVEAGKLMSQLREMGCQFALDDFGSGLSSFGYLKKLPVEYLKIDGMFVRDIVHDPTDRIFVKSIIDIAHSLNIKTIAEFVEDDEILKVVRDLGADYAQGFAIHRPEVLFPRFPVLAPGCSTAKNEVVHES